MMNEALMQIVHDVRWTDDLHLPHWRDRGIRFGFTGVGADCPKNTHHVMQVHGTHIVESGAQTSPLTLKREDGDGILSHNSGEIIGVKTADCLPLLFYHPECVMAVHAGWRGLTAGILKNALGVFKQRDIHMKDVEVAMGPCISCSAFEVGFEVVQSLQAGPHPLSHEELAFAVLKGKYDRWHMDLQTVAVIVLTKLGCNPQMISVLRHCTFAGTGKWHSFRRDKKQGGRNWSWIMCP